MLQCGPESPGIVSNGVMDSLWNDSEIANSDYRDLRQGGDAVSLHRTLNGIAGFTTIFEYKDLPTAGNLTGFFGTKDAILGAVRPVTRKGNPELLGIPSVHRFSTVSDPYTRLSLTAIGFDDPGLADLYMSIAAIYGFKAGADGGSAGDLTDYNGVRLISA